MKIRGYWMVFESAIPDSSTFDSAISDPKPRQDLLRSINFLLSDRYCKMLKNAYDVRL